MVSYFEKPESEKNDYKNFDNLDSLLFAKYNNFILNQEKLENNLYPNKHQTIYSNYKCTESNKNFDEKSIFNKIFGLDCEMVSYSYTLNEQHFLGQNRKRERIGKN